MSLDLKKQPAAQRHPLYASDDQQSAITEARQGECGCRDVASELEKQSDGLRFNMRPRRHLLMVC
jgi:hypothetical protein